jgi:hypothetical protein
MMQNSFGVVASQTNWNDVRLSDGGSKLPHRKIYLKTFS